MVLSFPLIHLYNGMNFKEFLRDSITVPKGNIFIPPQQIYPDTIERYRKTANFKLPKGVIDDGKKFPGWKSLGNYDSSFPKIYITDGVHRILSQDQEEITVQIEDGKFY